MTEWALIRPGASEYDQQGRIQGKLNMPLSAPGRQELEGLALQLGSRRPEVVYAAACEPAGETAAELARMLGLRCRRIDGLTNVDHGLWEGCLVDEVRRKHPKVFRQWEQGADHVCPPAGETRSEARGRVDAAVKRLLRRHRRGRIAVVAPSPLIDLIGEALGDARLGGEGCRCQCFGQWDLWEPVTPGLLAPHLPHSS